MGDCAQRQPRQPPAVNQSRQESPLNAAVSPPERSDSPNADSPKADSTKAESIDALAPEEQVAARAVLDRVGNAWWLVLLLGAVSLIAGILIFVHPFVAIRAAAVILGIWLLVSGLFQLVQSFDSELETVARVLSAMSGVIGIVLGIICFDSVEDRIALLTLFIGIWWIIRGVMQLVVGSSLEGGSGLVIFLGILGIFAGIVVLVWPIASLAVLAIVAGLWLIVLGVVEIITSFRLRSMRNQVEAVAGG